MAKINLFAAFHEGAVFLANFDMFFMVLLKDYINWISSYHFLGLELSKLLKSTVLPHFLMFCEISHLEMLLIMAIFST